MIKYEKLNEQQKKEEEIRNVAMDIVKENKLAPIGLTEKELAHCINDIIVYCSEMEDKNYTKDQLEMYGYYSRKNLIDKLLKLEKIYFPHWESC